MKTPLRLFAFLVLLIAGTGAQAQQLPVYSKARVRLDATHTLQNLAGLGVEVDHGQLRPGSFTTVFSSDELARIRAAGFQIETLVADVQRDFVERTQAARRARGGAPVPLSDYIDGACDNLKERQIPANFTLGSMGGHLTYEEAMAHLDSMHRKFPTLITARAATDTVRSIEGRPIYWVRLNGRAATPDTSQPEILFTSVHHAREPLGLHQLVFFLWYLLENYGRDPELTALVDRTQIYAIPFVNPDGYIFNQTNAPQGGGFWRKNRRANADGSFGVDINRNYGYNWGLDNVGSSPVGAAEVYRGEAAFSEPETRAVRNFCRQHRFKLCLNYHTFSDVLIYPYGFQNQQTADSATFGRLGHEIVRESHYAVGTCQQTLFYLTNGGSDDYMYTPEPGKPKIYAYTPEVGLDFWPIEDEILPQILRCQYQNIAALRAVHPFVVFKDSTGLFLRPGLSPSAGARIRYSLKRIGAGTGQAATFTLTLRPVGPGHASTQPVVRTYTNLALNTERIDSIPLTGSALARRLSYVVEISNGVYTTRDTIRHYDGQPLSSVAYADGCETTTGWTGGWTTEHSFPPSGRGYFSDGVGTYSYTLTPPDIEQNSMTRLAPFDLRTPGMVAAELSFLSRYDIRPFFDAADVEISVDSMASWTTVCSDNTHFSSFKHGQEQTMNQTEPVPIWDARKPFWSQEVVDLKDYLGQKIWLRFTLGIQAGASGFDGIQIDDIRIRYAMSSVTSTAPRTEQGLQAYPIPFQSQLRVEGVASVEVYDALGRRVSVHVSPSASSFEIDTRSWPAGVYQLRSGSQSVRVVKAD